MVPLKCYYNPFNNANLSIKSWQIGSWRTKSLEGFGALLGASEHSLALRSTAATFPGAPERSLSPQRVVSSERCRGDKEHQRALWSAKEHSGALLGALERS